MIGARSRLVDAILNEMYRRFTTALIFQQSMNSSDFQALSQPLGQSRNCQQYLP